jgi:hypothetical protein
MAVNLSSLAGAAAQFFDNNGVPLAGGLIYTYTAGTTTPATTYTSSTGLIAHANPIVLDAAGRIATGEVWLTTGVDYKFLVKTSANVQLGSYDNIPSINDFTTVNASIAALTTALANTSNVAEGDALIGFKQSNASGLLTGAVGKTVHQKLQEIVSVKDFGATGNGTTDDTAFIQAAIDSFPAAGGTLHFPPGTYKVTASINVNKPIHLIGGPAGSNYQPVTAPTVKLLWGSLSGGSVVKVGGFGTLISGGGMDGFFIDGNNIADTGLHLKDIQRAYFNGITITGTAVNGLLMQNTGGLSDPTGFCIFDDLRIQLRGGATNNANGINVDGTNTSGVEGVTLCTFRRARIDHANGIGVLVGNIGDAFTWDSLQTFRANVETGQGVWFAGTSPTAICGYHIFINPVVSAGFRFETPGLSLQTRIINANDIDLNTGIKLLFGDGCGDVRCDTGLGFGYGRELLPTFHFISRTDNMAVIRYDSANSVLHTAKGNWKTSTLAGGDIVSGGQLGSATRLSTGATLDNITAIYDVSTFGITEGFSPLYGIAFLAIVAPVTVTNVVVRIGLVDSNLDAPLNGIYFEFDPSISAYWRCVSVKAGISITLVSTLLGGAAKFEFYIFIQPDAGGATFYFRTLGNRFFATIGTIKTNIPTDSIAVIGRIKTTAAVDAIFDLYTIKVGTEDEF